MEGQLLKCLKKYKKKGYIEIHTFIGAEMSAPIHRDLHRQLSVESAFSQATLVESNDYTAMKGIPRMVSYDHTTDHMVVHQQRPTVVQRRLSMRGPVLPVIADVPTRTMPLDPRIGSPIQKSNSDPSWTKKLSIPFPSLPRSPDQASASSPVSRQTSQSQTVIHTSRQASSQTIRSGVTSQTSRVTDTTSEALKGDYGMRASMMSNATQVFGDDSTAGNVSRTSSGNPQSQQNSSRIGAAIVSPGSKPKATRKPSILNSRIGQMPGIPRNTSLLQKLGYNIRDQPVGKLNRQGSARSRVKGSVKDVIGDTDSRDSPRQLSTPRQISNAL